MFWLFKLNTENVILRRYLLDFNVCKVHIFWEGHNFLQNLHRRFVLFSNGQIYGGDFEKKIVAFSEYMNFKSLKQVWFLG